MSEYGALRKSIATYIHKYPSATKEDNERRLRRLHELKDSTDAKDVAECKDIRERMTLSNGGFAMKYVTRYSSLLTDDASVTDMFQEANLGILEAIDTFDVDRNTSFTTYAYFHIKKRIVDFIKHNKLVRAPRDIARNMKHVNEISCQLYTELGYEPTPEDVQRALRKRRHIDLKIGMITNILVLLDLNSSGHDETFISEFKDQAAVEQETDLFKMMEISIKKDLSWMNDRDKRIVELRFGVGVDYPHTLEEIKYMLGLEDEDLF